MASCACVWVLSINERSRENKLWISVKSGTQETREIEMMRNKKDNPLMILLSFSKLQECVQDFIQMITNNLLKKVNKRRKSCY